MQVIKEKDIARTVLYDFREEQFKFGGEGCYCDKCIESMRVALKNNKLI